jgi:hypothetical protein
MTQDEKHARIARELLGQDWWLSPYVCINGQRYDIPTWLRDGMSADWPGGGWGAGERPPDYSSSLDLCRQFETKIAERGWEAMELYSDYLDDLRAQTPSFVSEGRSYLYWWRTTAPPAARVNAACALLDALESAPKSP